MEYPARIHMKIYNLLTKECDTDDMRDFLTDDEFNKWVKEHNGYFSITKTESILRGKTYC